MTPHACASSLDGSLRLPSRHLFGPIFLALLSLNLAATAAAQKPAPVQPNDEEYTRKIHEYLNDPRFTTDLVDHLPASKTVPTPLKFLGTMPGQPGELYYSEQISSYFEALAKASPRAKYWTIGKSEEGRDMVVLAIGSEESIKNLSKYQGDLAALTDPRKTSEAEAQKLIHTSKPLYWITSGIHSPETGGPQMLPELAYRLMVEETPLIKNIREHTIVFITPVVETDGRDKQVDTYYYGKKTGKPKPPLMYWGKYVAHDNNRDGMGQGLQLTQNITKGVLTWHPTIFHDLHEAQSYLYVSTGTGPYNPSLDPIASNEWWLLAETEVMEMAKRNVPGVFTYGYYDGWVPNYLFWIAETHNSFGRFYEVQSYGPDVQEKLQLPATATSREWYRANPPLPTVKWGPRNNTNIQESALLIALDKVSTDHALYLENYWMKNKRSVDKGLNGPTYGWVIPAAQAHRGNAAEMVNDLRAQGVEFNIATSPTTFGSTKIAPGDYVIRADQPYRTLVDMYFSLQNFPAANPLPYDDTGWTMPLMRNVVVHPITDKAVLSATMQPLAAEVTLPGTITGSGSTLIIDANTDNVLTTFRFANPTVPMQAAEEPFELPGVNGATSSIPEPSSSPMERTTPPSRPRLRSWASSPTPPLPPPPSKPTRSPSRASATSIPGSAPRMKAGFVSPSTTTASPTPTSPTRSSAKAISAKSTTSSSSHPLAAPAPRRSTASRRSARTQSPTRRPNSPPTSAAKTPQTTSVAAWALTASPSSSASSVKVAPCLPKAALPPSCLTTASPPPSAWSTQSASTPRAASCAASSPTTRARSPTATPAMISPSTSARIPSWP